MATAVGKKFPNLNVDAMNEMGDTFKLNVLEEAVKNKKKIIFANELQVLRDSEDINKVEYYRTFAVTSKKVQKCISQRK